jgi:hypothetical protein
VDDGPRTGGLEALLLIIAVTFGYVAIGVGAWGASPIAIAAVAGIIWLERYARRRAREEEAERRRRLRDRSISYLDFEHDPFDSR